MTVYTIAQLKFTDIAAYRRYQAKFPDVFSKFDAKVLVADEKPMVVEGEWPRDKIVVLAFPSEAEAQRFATSPDYLEIAKDRKAGADAVVLLVKGFEPKA